MVVTGSSSSGPGIVGGTCCAASRTRHPAGGLRARTAPGRCRGAGCRPTTALLFRGAVVDTMGMAASLKLYQRLVKADRSGQEDGQQSAVARNGLLQVAAHTLQAIGDQAVNARTVLP